MANYSPLEVRPGTCQEAGAYQDGGGKRLSALKAVSLSLHRRQDQRKRKVSGTPSVQRIRLSARRAVRGGTGDGRYGKGSWQRSVTLGVFLMFLSMGVVSLSPTPVGAEPGLRQELEALKAQLEHDRMQMEQDRQRIEQLERQFESVEVKSEQKSKVLEEKITKQALSQPTFKQYLDRFAGEHRLSIVGYGFGTFEWQERANTNTFAAGLEPIFLYRLGDRLLFEGDLELKLEDTQTEVDLEYAQADYLLNDY